MTVTPAIMTATMTATMAATPAATTAKPATPAAYPATPATTPLTAFAGFCRTSSELARPNLGSGEKGPSWGPGLHRRRLCNVASWAAPAERNCADQPGAGERLTLIPGSRAPSLAWAPLTPPTRDTVLHGAARARAAKPPPPKEARASGYLVAVSNPSTLATLATMTAAAVTITATKATPIATPVSVTATPATIPAKPGTMTVALGASTATTVTMSAPTISNTSRHCHTDSHTNCDDSYPSNNDC